MHTGRVDRLVTANLKLAFDNQHNCYARCKIPREAIINDLARLRKLVDSDRYQRLIECKALRDGTEHHVTIVDPVEMRHEYAKRLAGELAVRFDFAFMGLGHLAMGASEAWFIVVESPKAQDWRKKLGLGSKDLHVTLGFYPADIYNLVKDRTTLVR
jgi:predicted N-acetyltransferase YhbS